MKGLLIKKRGNRASNKQKVSKILDIAVSVI